DLAVAVHIADVVAQQRVPIPAEGRVRFPQLELPSVVGGGEVPQTQAGVKITPLYPHGYMIGTQLGGLREGGVGVVPLALIRIPPATVQQGVGGLQPFQPSLDFLSAVLGEYLGLFGAVLLSPASRLFLAEQDVAARQADQRQNHDQRGRRGGDEGPLVPPGQLAGPIPERRRTGQHRLVVQVALHVLRQHVGRLITAGPGPLPRRLFQPRPEAPAPLHPPRPPLRALGAGEGPLRPPPPPPRVRRG